MNASDRRQVRSLGVQGPGRAAILTIDEQAPRAGQFWVDTVYSGLSAGTELTMFKGTNPYLHSCWDDQLCVFSPGQAAKRFPIESLGYMEVGRVAETHSPAVSVGQLVAAAYGHRTGAAIDARQAVFVPLPGDLDPLLGIYVIQMGPICANGLLHAAADLVGPDVRDLGDGVRGRNVLVTGAGVVGLLTALFARQHGAAEVVVADATTQRLEAAAGLGLSTVRDDGDAVWRHCKERWSHGPGDRGADLAFQCRGQTQHLATALRSLRPLGTVVDLAFYQTGAPEVRLGEEFHHNGLTVRCAQIARVPRGLGFGWDRWRLAAETIDLLGAHGAAIRQHVITDVVRFENGPSFLTELAGRRRHTIQAAFEFPREG